MFKRYVNLTNIILLALVVIALFLFLPCNKSCYKPHGDNTPSNEIIAMHEKDSLQALEKWRALADTMEFLKGQIELKDNQVIAGRITIDSFNNVIKALIKKHKPVTPAIDTNITVVQNEYVNDCEGCFTTLNMYNKRVEASTAEYNELNELYITQAATYDMQIRETQNERDACNKRFNALKAIATQKDYEATRKIKLGISGMSINSILPNAIGPGVMYEDKNGTDFIGRVLISTHGNVYDFGVFKTIRFKKRRK